MMRHFYLVMSLLLLLFVGCTVAPPTAVPNIPTTIPTPTLAAIEPTESAASAPTAIPDLPPTAVPNPNDLIALALAGLPTNAFDDVNALPLIVTDGERPLWVVHSEGFRNFDLDPFPNHFLAIFTVENGNWLELTRQNLNLESDELFVSPDFLSEGSVNQAIIDPAHIWLTVEGGVGAHGGTFQLLRFDGATLHIEAAASNSNPAVGYLEDLNSDGTPEVVMNMHDFYVFCYACGVRYLYYEVFAWDSVNQRMIEVSIQPMLMGQQGHPAYALNNRAVELANAGLWADALSQIEEAQRQAAATTEPTDTFVLEWNAALIRLYRDAWVAELSYSPYPLLTHIFFGDYTGASDIMRGYTHDQIFSADTPLIKGTMAEGSESWIPDYIFGQVNPAIAAQPDLAAAYYLRAWATFLQNPASPQIQADLDQAAALDPGEPLFTGTAPAANRIQFAPGATSAEISSQIADSGKEVYVLGAAAGQIMSVDLFSTDEFVRLEVSDSGGNWLDGQITPTFWQAELPQTADYVIRVVGGDAAADYTLIVAIPIRIQFEPGAISAQVQGDLNVYERDDYILRALAGQTMTVVINSPDNNVLLAIVGADGIPLVNGLMSSASKWSGQLPVTQDYNIRVLGMDQPATYTLDVTIE